MMQVWRTVVAACLGLVLLMVSAPAHAQYRFTVLVSNQLDDNAPNTDPLLVNAWGLARSTTSPWWISDNLSGWATVYGATGTPASLKVLIPTFGDGPVLASGHNGVGTPTGIVSDGVGADFEISSVVDGVTVSASPSFFFATLDGTISAFGGANRNIATIDYTSTDNASYTGLAITNNATGKGLNFLYAADNTNNVVDAFQVVDGTLTLVNSFTDPSIPVGFSAFGVQDINGMVYVTYAATNGGADGFVVVFTEAGKLPTTLIQGFPLNQPWGVVLAPSNFGPLSNTLLISNNSIPGTINAFNPGTGEFVGTIKDQHGKDISLNQPWAIVFGSGNVNATTGASDNGAANELFVTVGPGNAGQNENAGLFASIVFDPTNNRDHDQDHDDGH